MYVYLLDDDDVGVSDTEAVENGKRIAEKTQAKAAKESGTAQTTPKAKQISSKTIAAAGGTTSSVARAER